VSPVFLIAAAVYIGIEYLAARLLAAWIGWGGVALVMMILFIIGMAVCRRAGFAAFRGSQVLVDGHVVSTPAGTGLGASSLGDAGLRFVAGVMIALPGLVTSAAGLVMLIPAARGAVGRFSSALIRRRAAAAGLILDEDFRPSTFADGAVPGEVYRPPAPRTVIEGHIVRDDGDK
jgi:UPF0716 protein FxsA